MSNPTIASSSTGQVYIHEDDSGSNDDGNVYGDAGSDSDGNYDNHSVVTAIQ